MYINDRASKHFVNIFLGLILLANTFNSSNLSKEFEPLNNTTLQNDIKENPESNSYLNLELCQKNKNCFDCGAFNEGKINCQWDSKLGCIYSLHKK